MNFIEQIVNFNQEILNIAQRPQNLIPASEAKISIESLIEEATELREAFAEKDFIKGVDAVADTLFFAVGVMYKFGLTPKQIQNAVLLGYNELTEEVVNLAYKAYVEPANSLGYPSGDYTNDLTNEIESLVGMFSNFYADSDLANSVQSCAMICRTCLFIFGEFGISAKQTAEIMNAVYTANMTKKKGVNAKRGDGLAADAVKPADFVPPEKAIEMILESK